jgi:tetratricopeptide (TPR) repeat protein
MSEINEAFATGFAAAERGDLPTARSALGALNKLLPQTPAAFDTAGTPRGDPMRRVPEIQQLELLAVILSAEGNPDQAIAMAQQAVAAGEDLPYAFGPPSPEKPPHELLGELLLNKNRNAEARAAFAASLERAPQRTESLSGLARAESALGDKAAAIETWRQLLGIWKNADPDSVEREDARRHLSALAQIPH